MSKNSKRNNRPPKERAQLTGRAPTPAGDLTDDPRTITRQPRAQSTYVTRREPPASGGAPPRYPGSIMAQALSRSAGEANVEARPRAGIPAQLKRPPAAPQEAKRHTAPATNEKRLPPDAASYQVRDAWARPDDDIYRTRQSEPHPIKSILDRALDEEIRQSARRIAVQSRYAIEESWNDLYDSAPPELRQHIKVFGCLLLCARFVWALFSTPLGEPTGLYHGPTDWSAWWSQQRGSLYVKTSAPGADLPAGVGDGSILGRPTISAQQIDSVLAEYGSPAAGTGQVFYDLGIKYGIDPAYALAFFIHESSAGTNPGWAGLKPGGGTTHNIGNIICAGYPTCFGRFRDYATWEEGIEDWYKLISVEYVGGRGAHTLEQIIPIYAPSFENNVPAYVQAVNNMVAKWRAQGVR